MASEKSSTSEENVNNQTTSENIYDIFGTNPDTADADEKERWVDTCHGCLRFFYCIFLFVFVFLTALISRITFHILLININPPTIFTTMNKFGGDIGNPILPFLPAQVHVSWIWACFLVLVLPSVHSFVYHIGQWCRKRDFKVINPGENKQKMVFLTLSSNAAKVDPSTINWNLQEPNASTLESQPSQYTVKECDINCNTKMQWIIIIVLGTVQAICETIAVFVLLPTFDQATSSIIAVFMTISTPTLLNGIMNPYFCCPKKLCFNWMQTTSRVFSFLLYLLNLGLIVYCVHEISTNGNGGSPVNSIIITFFMSLFLSIGFWENLSGFQFERFNKRPLLMMILSFMKCIAMFVTFLLTFLAMGCNEGVRVLFSGVSNATITLLDKNILLVNTLPFNGDCSFSQPMIIGLISVFASYGCYKSCYYACRTYLQYQSFSIPLILNLFLVPIIVFVTFNPDTFFSEINNCSIISKEWDFNIDKGNALDHIQTLIVVCGGLTFCHVLLLTTYIWRSGLRIAKLEKMFAMPFYAGYAVDITLLWSRRRNIEHQMHNTRSGKKSTSDSTSETKTDSERNADRIDRQVKMIPFIYLCATMWHENELEMKTLLRSIFRLNKYQWTMTCRQNVLMQKKKIKRPEEKYFQFEAHIFFDDAFKENKEKVENGNSKTNKKFNKIRGKEVNDFVKQFIKCVEETSRSYYNVKKLDISKKFTTPYGARLEWDLESPPEETKNQSIEKILAVPCRLILHLKDKFLIRNKKRWSQVMYMYYLLSYIPMAKKTNLIESMRQDNERPSTSENPHPVRPQDPKNNKDLLEKEHTKFKTEIAPKTFILALDGDVDFKPDAVLRLLERMLKNPDVGAACGRIIPKGRGPVVWYQKFEYAVSHWLQKATEHVFGCVLCSPGCFSLFRASALMSNNVIKIYTKNPTSGLECIQFDQGEDRWLSTLLLNQGFKIEYTAASDAYTYVPEGFFEFFNQRRRWSPSTLANIFEIISNSSSVSKANTYITRPYLLYHTFLFVSSFITPGTIFLMILGATYLAFPGIPLWVAFVTNFLLISIVMASCVLAEQKTQLNIIASISALYALMMIVVLFGLILDAIRSDFCSVTTYFFFYVAGIFFLAALLHPREFLNILHGALYFLAVPTTSMLMLIYALGNLHVTSWGTRESNKIIKRKNQAVGDSLDTCSCFGLCRCTCMPQKPGGKTNKKDKGGKSSNQKKVDSTSKETEKLKSTETQGEAKLSEDAQIPKTEECLVGAEDVENDEKQFWKDIIKSYLSPDVKEEKNLKEDLKSFRNGVYAGFIMMNLIYITLVFVITQTNELNNNVFTIRLPCPNKTGTFDVDPISVVFSITFGLVLFFQFIGMLIHRYSTFTHIVAVSKMIRKSFKNICESDTRTLKQSENVDDTQLKHHTATSNLYQGNYSKIPENLKDKGRVEWSTEVEKVTYSPSGSLATLKSVKNVSEEIEPISHGGSIIVKNATEIKRMLSPIKKTTEKKKKKKRKKKQPTTDEPGE